MEIILNAVPNGTGDGGGVYLAGDYLTRNSATFDVTSGGSVFFSKNAAACGGGFYNFSGEATLTNTTFNNTTASQYGGAMYISSFTSTTFGNTLVQGNTLAPGGTAGPGVLYEQGAQFPNNFVGLTDNDDPGGKPVQK